MDHQQGGAWQCRAFKDEHAIALAWLMWESKGKGNPYLESHRAMPSESEVLFPESFIQQRH